MTLQLMPNLIMDGQAKDAIGFYQQVLNVEVIEMAMFSDMPEPSPENIKDRVAHVRI